MSEDTLYSTGLIEEDFAFNDRVAEVFDDMLNRSIPYYSTVIDGMAQLLACRLPAGRSMTWAAQPAQPCWSWQDGYPL